MSKHRNQTPLYRCWTDMKQRCNNPRNASYPMYGGRGIKVCERWNNSFENFAADVGPKPPGLSIDRIDNNKGYEPGNVRWITHQQQMLNTQASRRWFIDGQMFMSAREAAAFYKTSEESICRWCRRLGRKGCYTVPAYPKEEAKA